MAKKKENLIRIDHIPESCRQRRSHPRRRTDFAALLSDPFHGAGSLPRSPGSKDTLSSVTIASLDDMMEKRTETAKIPLVKCNNSEGKEVCSDTCEVPIDEVESVAGDVHFESSDDRTFHEQKDDNDETSDTMPIKSQVIVNSSAFTNPGSVVWAKTACQVWWPAEVMEDKSSDSINQSIDGHVLVQYYGNHHSAWVDPDNLSQFQDCFEERSCNPMEDFQDALKQALDRMRHVSSCGQLVGSPSVTDSLNQQDQTSEKCNSLNSSRTEDDSIERGRGKRKRKPKVHFDAETFPLKPARKVRRFRIMRYLGLIAPIGSPFSLAHARIPSK